MDKRISGLIRHFDGLASPSYVPETPLPRDPGKSASLPLAEALSTVEPGATATLIFCFCYVLCFSLSRVRPQQQTRRPLLLLSIDGTDRRTDGH